MSDAAVAFPGSGLPHPLSFNKLPSRSEGFPVKNVFIVFGPLGARSRSLVTPYRSLARTNDGFIGTLVPRLLRAV